MKIIDEMLCLEIKDKDYIKKLNELFEDEYEINLYALKKSGIADIFLDFGYEISYADNTGYSDWIEAYLKINNDFYSVDFYYEIGKECGYHYETFTIESIKDIHISKYKEKEKISFVQSYNVYLLCTKEDKNKLLNFAEENNIDLKIWD